MCAPPSMNLPLTPGNERSEETNPATPTKKANQSRPRSQKRSNTSKAAKNIPKNHKQIKKGNKKSSNKNKSPKTHQPKKIIEQEITLEEQGKYVALDCEFVGVGPGGYESALARVSLVDYNNTVLIDTVVKVHQPVTDYRTFVSGITEEHLSSNHAMDAEKCISLVKKMLHNKILIGHGLKSDLSVLGINHPWYDIRDTAKYEPFMKKAKKNDPSQLPRARKLKDLALTKLNRVIQKEGEPHCSLEDAIAALDLYKKARTKWENVMNYKIDRTRQIEFLDQIEVS